MKHCGSLWHKSMLLLGVNGPTPKPPVLRVRSLLLGTKHRMPIRFEPKQIQKKRQDFFLRQRALQRSDLHFHTDQHIAQYTMTIVNHSTCTQDNFTHPLQCGEVIIKTLPLYYILWIFLERPKKFAFDFALHCCTKRLVPIRG